MSSQKSPADLSTDRVESLADGIFGFAMTLLVLNLTLPDGVEPTSAALLKLLSGQVRNFYTYVLSFLILGSYWAMHHRQHQFITRTDVSHLWINIFLLMFVALVPFSTTLISDFGNTVLGEIIFALNLLMLSVLLLLNWLHAVRNSRLVPPETDAAAIRDMTRRFIILPTVPILVLLVCPFFPSYASLLYVLLPVLYWAPVLRRRLS